MKKKNLLLGLVLSLGFAAAASATLAVANKPAILTHADDASGVSLYLKTNSNWAQSSARFALYYFSAATTTASGWVDMDLVSGETNVYKATVPEKPSGASYDYDTVIFCRMKSGTTENNWDNKWDQTNDLTYATATNLYTIADGAWSKGAGTWSSYSEPTTYIVSEYAVVDGVAEATAFATEIGSGNSNFTPTKVIRSGYHFEGWYSDSACGTAYVAAPVTAAMELYAKYTTLADRTVYFQTVTGWTNTYVYSYGGTSQYGAFPGTMVSDITEGINFQTLGGIVKVTFSKTYDDSYFIFNDGTASSGVVGTNQSHNLKIAAGAYYWFSAADDSTGDADKGMAAAVVYDINIARHAVTASGSILAASVCGISKATATSLVSEYDALNDTAKGYAGAATDYVYNYADTNSGVDTPIADIIVQLRKIASAGSGAAVVDNKESNLTPVIIMVVSLGIAAIASAGLWLSRRKEH